MTRTTTNPFAVVDLHGTHDQRTHGRRRGVSAAARGPKAATKPPMKTVASSPTGKTTYVYENKQGGRIIGADYDPASKVATIRGVDESGMRASLVEKVKAEHPEVEKAVYVHVKLGRSPSDTVRTEEVLYDRTGVLEPPEKTAVRGTPMSSKAKGADPGMSRIVDRVTRAIDGIHGDGPLKALTVSDAPDAHHRAMYKSTGKDDPRIEVRAGSRDPEFSFAHEVGHWLDNIGWDAPRPTGHTAFASNRRDDPRAKALMEAIERTGPGRKLRAFDQAIQNDEYPEGYEDDDEALDTDAAYILYLSEGHEMFARAYAQYVATRSDDDVLKGQLRLNQKEAESEKFPRQWSDEEFETIADRFDDLFRGRGWLNGE